MNADQFSGPKLKIERANHHIQDLASSIDTFLKTDFYRLRIEVNANGDNILKLNIDHTPIDFPLIIGDIIHNLRPPYGIFSTAIVSAKAGI